MRFYIDDLLVLFPYEFIYPEQLEYIKDIKKTLDNYGNALLEMPSGTGKTISLLALIIAYQRQNPDRKLIYCSRTVQEIEKALQELKRLLQYYETQNESLNLLAVGLSSRKNLCINDQVKNEKDNQKADSKCRTLTSQWRKNQVCDFYENLETKKDLQIPKGVYTLQDMKVFAASQKICPYFFTRKIISFANVIIYSYHYLLDPKVAEQVSKELSKNSIVVFDEAHNIDNVCIESLSIDISRYNLDSSTKSIEVFKKIN
jgi:DNA excision repair protein ERCC-2